MDQGQTSALPWLNASSHTPRLNLTAISVEVAVVDSINFASMISVTAPDITGTALGLPLSTSVVTLTDTTSVIVVPSSIRSLTVLTPASTQGATTTITRSISALQSGPVTSGATWQTPVATADQTGLSSTTALPSHSIITESTSVAATVSLGSPTSVPAAVSGIEDNTSAKVTLIVAIVVPGVAFAVAAIWLFWFWLKKKRQREKILDDLERTAIWVSTSNRSPLMDAQITAPPTPPKDITPIKSVVDESGSPTTIRTVRSEDEECEEVGHEGDNDESIMDAVSVRSSMNDPFETPTSQRDDETIRASQIGLAITTSMYSNMTGSASTIIRHASRRFSNPFSTPPPSIPARRISINSSTSDISAVVVTSSTPPPSGIEPPANSMRTPYLHARQSPANANTSSAESSNQCLNLGHHICSDATDCPLTHLMYAKVLDMGRRTNNIVDEQDGDI